MSAFEPRELPRQNELAGVPLASFIRRAAAFMVDFFAAFLLFLGLLIYGSKFLAYAEIINPDLNLILKFDLKHWYSLAFLVLYFGLFTYFSNGKTPGKWLFKIRVVSLGHERISLWNSVERALGYGASILEFGFGFFQYFIHPNRRTVHDRIAETIVIKDRPTAQTVNENPPFG